MDLTIKTNKHEAYPGEKIECTIQVLTKNKTKTKRIVASFYGEFLSVYHTNKSNHTNRNVFFTIEKPLWMPDDSKAGIINPGLLEFKADFEVPEGLMPSFPPASMADQQYPGRLQFFIKVVATKVIGFEDERFERIFVLSKDFISKTTEHRRTGGVSITKTKPAASVTLEKSIYKPGQTINCKIDVDKKDANCNIQDARIMLRNQCWGWVDGAWHIADVFCDEYSLGAMEATSKMFALVVPDMASPTIYGGNVMITWDVHLHVKLSLAKDVHLTVPIIVAAREAIVLTEEVMRDAVPGVHFCPSCGSPIEFGSKKCKLCNEALDEN